MTKVTEQIDRVADVADARRKLRLLGENIGKVAGRPVDYWRFEDMELAAREYLAAVHQWRAACQKAGVAR